MFDKIGVAINDLQTRIDNTLLEDRQRRWMSDSQNSLREFYKTDVIPMSNSLSKNLKELKDELIKEVQEMLNTFDSMEQKVDGKSSKENILQKDIERILEVSLTSEIRDCVLLSAIRTQHQKEVDELIEHVNQKTYAYADVCAQNQDLLMIISELKDKLRTIDKGKNVNTKFDKSEASGTLLCVTPLPKNIAIKAKKVSNSKVNADRSKPVTSHPTPTNEQGVESSNSVRRQKSKDTKSKNRVLKNTNAKILNALFQKMSRSVSIDSNKNSSVKRALFTTPVAAKSENLGTTFVVEKSRLGVANIPKATNKVIQLVLWIVDSGCSKHMTGNLQLLRNFVEKFMGTVRFRNDHFAVITGYGDYVQGNLTICHVYYVEGLGHNLFLVEQFCDGDLEVAFRSNTCYVRNLEGDDLLTDSQDLNLYTISISEMAASSPVCLMSRATSIKS
ncbi:hypothetical protein Tco_0624295 [Tanacetum coccineum]|uniref:Retrovirus-related Pol polyprotein from transposon TNT 1-94-like beta-barrel domain-containing protein n=1 Tax=Tanacetum coccineum TaxID=301880 RepID=A0ABQ4WDL8_9ASTR